MQQGTAMRRRKRSKRELKAIRRSYRDQEKADDYNKEADEEIARLIARDE